MKKCPNCAAGLKDDCRFCLYCMTSLEPKTPIKINTKLKKRWPYIITTILILITVTVSISIPFIKDNSADNSIKGSHKTESTPKNETTGTVTYSNPSIINSKTSNNSGASITPSKSNSDTSSNNITSSKKENSVASATSVLDLLYISEYRTGICTISGVRENVSGRLVLPDTYNNMPIDHISAMAFFDQQISSVYIPSNIKYIEDNAFQGCALTEIQFSEGLEEILCGAFAECKNLKTISLPNSLLILQSYAFSDCKNLTSVTLGSNITEIWEEVFDGCNNLQDVYYRGTKEDRDKIIILEGNDPLLNATWHYIT